MRRMKIIMINFCSLVSVLSASILAAFGVSPELNSPRIGDELTLLELSNVVVSQPSVDECIDLSNATMTSESEFRVCKPAKEDTLTTMIIAVGRRNIGLATVDNQLYKNRSFQPGQRRIYLSAIPYNTYMDTLTVHELKTSGLIARIGQFTSKGLESSCMTRDTKLITFDGDTLTNVECVRTSIDEEFMYEYGDTVRHIGEENKWYVPGYRYPALTYTADIMISHAGDTIDYVSHWEAIDLKQQEEKIKVDQVNECLRDILKKSFFTNKYVNHTEVPGDGSFRKGNIEWDAKTKTLTVLPTFNTSDEPVDYILCDAYGRVFRTGSLSSNVPFELSLVDFPRGVYVFALYNDQGLHTIKITKR
ncbi:MAG: T9SS type A sorting domain-containing protein [Muribaculaceae bacterium]|nr:T9SS type A sorting domain-containing protein [Muribaculaceae bacterium]